MNNSMQADDAEVSESESLTPPVQHAPVHIIDAKYEAHRCYTIIGRDDDEILRTAGQLLAGSQLLAGRELMVANLTSSFKRIADWASARRDLLLAVYITVRRGESSLFFVTSGDRYDVALDAQMTDLEVQLGGSAGIGAIESFQIPRRSIDQFVSPDSVQLWER